MSQIEISNLTFAYEGSYDLIFKQLNLKLDTNWKLGLVGRNGKGKTTLLKLLIGEEAGSGTIHTTVPFAYFPYPVLQKDDFCIDIMTEKCGDLPYWQILRELNLLGLDEELLYRPFSTLSQGEQTKLLLASLFLIEDAFLLIDEPTNHLDHHGRVLVAEYLKRKNGFILVSHDRDFLDESIDHILTINRESITLQKGNFSSWYDHKERVEENEKQENSKLKREINRLQKAAQQTANWSDKMEKTKLGSRNSGLRPDRGFIGAQAARMMKRAKTIEDRRTKTAEEKEKLLKDIEEVENLKLSPLLFHSKRLTELKHLSIHYGEHIITEDLSFILEQGDRIAITGKNGSGKSSLLKLILGQEIPYAGELFVAKGLKISYLSQDTSYLMGNLKDFIQQRGLDESLFKAILRKLDFSRLQFEKKLEDYSQGQKKKVLLAASLSEQAHLYIWDEPLNYIDVFSRMQIEEVLLQYQPTMLLVEHDQAFCRSIATKQIDLS